MDITVYLPDEIGQWAKDAGLNLSQTLRSEVEAERSRRQAVTQTLAGAEVHTLTIEHPPTGTSYRARLYAARLHGQTGSVQAFLGRNNHEIYVYDERDNSLTDDVAAEDLRNYLSDAEYIEAMNALGKEAVIDIG